MAHFLPRSTPKQRVQTCGNQRVRQGSPKRARQKWGLAEQTGSDAEIKMLNFFKNIFATKPARGAVAESNGHAPRIPTPSPARSTSPAARPVPPAPARTKAPARASGPVQTPARQNIPAAPPSPVQGMDKKTVQLSLSNVLNGLPIELKGRIKQADVGAAEISIPMETVLSQLATGSVKITFGQMRRAAPQLFSSQSDLDQTPVALPLGDILAQLNPALLPRRQDQKHILVPDDIRSPFGDHGAGLVFSASPGKTPAASPPRAAAPAPAIAPAPAFAPAQLEPPAPPPAAPVAMPTIPFSSAPVRPAPARVAGSAPRPVSSGTTKVAFARGQTPPPAQRASISMPTPQTASQAAPQPQRVPAPTPASNEPPLNIPLASLAQAWPESLKMEIGQSASPEAVVAIPIQTLKESLQRGKVFFPWKQIRAWVNPAMPPVVSAHDNTSLELPLHVIAPLFVARERDLAKAKQKVALDETIPNLFFGFPQPDSADPSVPPAPAACAVTRPVDTNYYSLDDSPDASGIREQLPQRPPPTGTEFISRCATPNEIVSRAASLNGVAGALIALPDGLMVASHVSSDLNGDTIAAFLPQIFGKVNQCTKELRMGELNNLNFTVGNVPWKIFRVNAIFFAAFGRAGQPLPTAELAALAAELDRKKQ